MKSTNYEVSSCMIFSILHVFIRFRSMYSRFRIERLSNPLACSPKSDPLKLTLIQ